MKREKYVLSGEDKANLGLVSVIFILGLFFGVVLAMMVCMPLKVHAAESTTNDYYFVNKLYLTGSSNPYQVSKYSISTDLRFCLLEIEPYIENDMRHTCYVVVCSENISNSQKLWNVEYSRGYADKALTQLGFDSGACTTYFGLSASVLKNMSQENLNIQRAVISWDEVETNMPIFTSIEDAAHYIETGYNPTDISEKFTDVYDPSMPVPQLGNITHAGFTVVDAPEGKYYLQLQIESTVHGMEFRDSVSVAGNGIKLGRDVNWIYAQQTRNLGSWDVPVSNQLTYNLVDDWDYDNVLFLSENSYNFFSQYPYIEDLPGWNFWKHGIDNDVFKEQRENAMASYINRDDESLSVSCLNKSFLPTTKYYVRYVFYDVSESGEYVPRYSQWMSYKVGYDLLTVSPVVGDASGKPLDIDPVTGTLDENGNYLGDLGSGLGSGFDINTDNPVEMLADVISWLATLPELFGDFSLFLQDAFAFVPSFIWKIFGSGFAICVLCVILKYA